MTELRANDLRFTPTEATAFLNDVMGLGLSTQDVTTLDSRTEGWVAGLQLAALALQGTFSTQGHKDARAFIKAFGGSHRLILDYLVVVTVILTFIMWAIVPLLGLVGYHLVTSEEMLETRRSWVVLVTVLVIEVILTFVLPPRIAGIQNIPAVLRWGIPAVTTLIVTVVTANVARRREDVHLFGTFLLFTASNSLLQMALYLLF